MSLPHESSNIELLKATKLALLGEVTGSILHELNQPLTAMSIDAGYLKMLAEKPDELSAEMLIQVGADIEDDIHRLQKITQHLRAFAYEREQTLHTHLKVAVENIMSLIGEQFRARAIKWEFEFKDDLPSVAIDAIELEYILLNIFLNARKAIDLREKLCPEKPFQKSLTLKAWRNQDRVMALVKDNGLNLSHTNLHRLWQPFFTVHVAKERQYYNLFLVAQLLEKVGGKCQVHQYFNGEGMGNAIELTLPAWDK
jgi:two-component system C4-dicarboxylate transport sensor histidine kinase DctB